MPANTSMLGQALDELKPTDWEHFERLCHAFFASEFGDLYRSAASSSGDEGRDGELFSPVGRANVVLQFSIRDDWRSKIRETVERLKETKRKVGVLIYATNQEIGALADDIKAEYRGKPLIDVRDRGWFVSRANSDENRAQAACALVESILGSSADVAPKATGKLTGDESRTLLFFLELQHDDEVSGKGFTKSCFDALVRSVLHQTTAKNAVTLDDIYQRISKLLPQHDLELQLKPYIDAAIGRLLKSVVKHNRMTGEYHLANDEHDRIAGKAAEISTLRKGFLADLEDDIAYDPRVAPEDAQKVRDYMANVIERYLHGRGEAFASAVVRGDNLMDDESELMNAIAQTSPTPRLKSKQSAAAVCHSIARTFLRTPSEQTLAYLKLLSDCYTLFAFLAAVPDVQRATKKIFDRGEIWLDTTVILPLLAEWHSAASGSFDRPFTLLFRQLNASGLKLYITDGVVEEILTHLERCVTFAHSSAWDGDVPYVAAQLLLNGVKAGAIPSLLEEFRSHHKPEDDLEEFLGEEFGIQKRAVEDDSQLPAEVRDEIVDYWQRTTEKRKRARSDEMTQMRLARHDAENYMNVLIRRTSTEPGSWLGYTSWWLTLDTFARRLLDDASTETRDFVRHQPIVSLDFLTRYLTFGPIRSKIDQSVRNPLELYASEIALNVPSELIAKAQDIRNELGALSERRKRRRITAALDEQRTEYGELHNTRVNRVADAMALQAEA